MRKREDIVRILKPYLQGEEAILMGFLFGSYASEHPCEESDVDVALYIKEGTNKLEIKIQNDLERLLKKQVDVIFLNRSPTTLSWTILRKGIPLTIKDRGLYLDFLLDVSREAQDFLEFNLDAWRMKYGVGTSG